MHLLYYKQKYCSLTEAKKKPDGLSVIGVLFNLSDNQMKNLKTSVLEPIINGISKVKKVGQTANIAPFSISIFGLKKFYPYKYVTYQGSLTTPPCSEIVTWLLSSISVDITIKQMQAFWEIELANSDKANNRPIQALNGRELQIVWNSKF
ncbi:carbonic anhydrase 2-like [Belonocnema kinseyi]|uniref:carbonic anhydrase 2-like n=1 Tax=Belonocnema kinseyi TaxID=2817044 RepID=UPI00143CC76D|nr:carbonic anhydrase 2-like [Belonocnema kinseyi]